MKLSTLVGQRQGLKDVTTSDIKELVNNTLTKIITDINNVGIDTNEYTAKLTKVKQQLAENFSIFEEELIHFTQDLNREISEQGRQYYEKSQEVYDTAKENDSSAYTADRFLFSRYINRDDIKETFLSRLELYSSWKHPALFIRPEQGDYVEPFLSNDPMYIADESDELLSLVKNKWTNAYQSRIRYRCIREHRADFLSYFPKSQFGVIVAYNFFNFKPLDTVKRYLLGFLELLKDGGIVVFTYNNCDLKNAVIQVENAYNSYIPKSTLVPLAEAIGFEVVESFDLETNVSWIELKKPGELTSIRGGQALALIKDSRLDN